MHTALVAVFYSLMYVPTEHVLDHITYPSHSNKKLIKNVMIDS